MPNLGSGKYVLLQNDVPTTVVNLATATGVAKSIFFAVPAAMDGQQRTAAFVPRQVGGVTAFTATILASSDGGTTTQAYPATPNATLTFIATSVLTPQTVTNLVPGITYELSVATLTGGTNVSVDAVVS